MRDQVLADADQPVASIGKSYRSELLGGWIKGWMGSLISDSTKTNPRVWRLVPGCPIPLAAHSRALDLSLKNTL